MEKFLRFGFVAILVSIIGRYAVSYFADIGFFDIGSMSELEKWIYSISFLWSLFAFWNDFVRRRCPECSSTNHAKTSEREIDRWVGSKTVRQKVSENTYADTYVPTTFVNIQSTYNCHDCGCVWDELVKQEKN